MNALKRHLKRKESEARQKRLAEIQSQIQTELEPIVKLKRKNDEN